MIYEISERETITEAVVLAVSSLQQRDPTDVPPLTDTLDPDALEALFTRDDATTNGDEIYLSFVYCNSRVTIRDATAVEVLPIQV